MGNDAPIPIRNRVQSIYVQLPAQDMRRVTQIEVKTGDFIDSYDNKDAFLIASHRLEKAAKLKQIDRELVYVILPVAGKTMWQIFLMPKEWKDT
jgi:hypothetical protein